MWRKPWSVIGLISKSRNTLFNNLFIPSFVSTFLLDCALKNTRLLELFEGVESNSCLNVLIVSLSIKISRSDDVFFKSLNPLFELIPSFNNFNDVIFKIKVLSG